MYTLETGFHVYRQKDNDSFTVNIFINLADLRDRAYKGRSYRDVQMAHLDVTAWFWLTKKQDHLIETHIFISTSELKSVAEEFSKNGALNNEVSVLFIFDSLVSCDTAIKLICNEQKEKEVDATFFWKEKEALVTPYTLFKVEDIRYDDQNPSYEIRLTHVPIES